MVDNDGKMVDNDGKREIPYICDLEILATILAEMDYDLPPLHSDLPPLQETCPRSNVEVDF